jgi:hypothetical protein
MRDELKIQIDEATCQGCKDKAPLCNHAHADGNRFHQYYYADSADVKYTMSCTSMSGKLAAIIDAEINGPARLAACGYPRTAEYHEKRVKSLNAANEAIPHPQRHDVYRIISDALCDNMGEFLMTDEIADATAFIMAAMPKIILAMK